MLVATRHHASASCSITSTRRSAPAITSSALSADHGVADIPEQIPGGGRAADCRGSRGDRSRDEAGRSAATDRSSLRRRAATSISSPGVYDGSRTRRRALKAIWTPPAALPGVAPRVRRATRSRRRRARTSKDRADPRRRAQLLPRAQRRPDRDCRRRTGSCRRRHHARHAVRRTTSVFRCCCIGAGIKPGAYERRRDAGRPRRHHRPHRRRAAARHPTARS